MNELVLPANPKIQSRCVKSVFHYSPLTATNDMPINARELPTIRGCLYGENSPGKLRLNLALLFNTAGVVLFRIYFQAQYAKLSPALQGKFSDCVYMGRKVSGNRDPACQSRSILILM